jgi:hypothetical protein
VTLRIRTSDFHGRLHSRDFRFILGLGFDRRCTVALEAIIESAPKNVVGLVNVGWQDANTSSVARFMSLTRDNGRIVGRDASNILQLADQISAEVDALSSDVLTVIDVTSMSHELLAILVGILNYKSRLSNIVFCYNGADRYSVNSDEDNVWLSRGVSSIRSILGYPGTQLPSKPLHLLVTVGFEVERAAEVINRYEPAALSLGVGHSSESVSAQHHKTNQFFFEHLERFLSDQDRSYQTFEKFEFSCVDPLRAKSQLQQHLARYSEYNSVICPLNTKLSTLGAALLCLEDASIQLCYAQPIEYNTEGYASPGEWLTLVPFGATI